MVDSYAVATFATRIVHEYACGHLFPKEQHSCKSVQKTTNENSCLHNVPVKRTIQTQDLPLVRFHKMGSGDSGKAYSRPKHEFFEKLLAFAGSSW